MLSILSLLFVPTVFGLTFSNYYAGSDEGACGAWHQDSEWVVAIPMDKWDGGSHCNEQVYITANGKSAVATIVDECGEGCASDLDFSQSLFGYFVGGEQNNNEVGLLYNGNYVFGSGPSNGGGGGGGNNDDDDDTTTTSTHHTTSTTSTKHTTSTPPPPPPTTTSTTHSTTSTHSTTTSTSASHSASKPASASASASHTSASASVLPSPPAGPQNLQDFSELLVNLAGLAMQAPHAV
ncbi:hypothetical protein B0H12DRAFT_1141990 [Mycena haematopus]|nr:hypothetical protein B0H12DRAFT_1141990 [Mycena haematopus]